MSTPTITRPGPTLADPHGTDVGAGSDFDSGQSTIDAHAVFAAVEHTSPQARPEASPIEVTPAGTTLPDPAIGESAPNQHSPGRERNGDGSPAMGRPTPHDGSLDDPSLRMAAEILSDAEDNRKANANRLRYLTRTEADKDGEERGLGLDESDPAVARLAALVGLLEQVEKAATKNLEIAMRQHPLGPFVKSLAGVGDKQAARLLAAVGDPYWNALAERPRLVSELWSYCGHGDATRRPVKGMSQSDMFRLGNPEAKMRLWNIAAKTVMFNGAIKSNGSANPRSPYRDVYDTRKAATEGREHATACARCGPSGHPAQPGSPWSDAHRHADALRIVGKEILRDLWHEAKRIHEGATA